MGSVRDASGDHPKISITAALAAARAAAREDVGAQWKRAHEVPTPTMPEHIARLSPQEASQLQRDREVVIGNALPRPSRRKQRKED